MGQNVRDIRHFSLTGANFQFAHVSNLRQFSRFSLTHSPTNWSQQTRDSRHISFLTFSGRLVQSHLTSLSLLLYPHLHSLPPPLPLSHTPFFFFFFLIKFFSAYYCYRSSLSLLICIYENIYVYILLFIP